MFSCLFSTKIDSSKLKPLTRAEEILWNLDTSDIHDMPMLGFRKHLAMALESAKCEGTLPKQTDLHTVEISLNSILIGVPYSLREFGFQNLREMYRQQLDILWVGLKNF